MMEEKMPLTLSFLLCLIVLIIFNPLTVSSDPDPMARPTRPKAFTSADELKRYLDLVRDYYSLSGKARYGKRSKIVPINDDNPLEILRLPITSTSDLIKAALKNNHIIEHFNKIHHFSPIENEKFIRDISNDRYGINDLMTNIKHQDNQKKDQQKKLQIEEKEKEKEEEEIDDDDDNDNDDDDDRDNDFKKFQIHEQQDLPYLYEAMAKYYDDFQ